MELTSHSGSTPRVAEESEKPGLCILVRLSPEGVVSNMEVVDAPASQHYAGDRIFGKEGL